MILQNLISADPSLCAMSIPIPPSKPGVYLFKDNAGTVIYIGKAKNLKKRVQSYFRRDVSVKTAQLVSHITDAEYFITSTELESFLLESRLIKKFQPKYNIMLKSGVQYAYLKVTQEKFPRLLEVRRVTKDGTYFGPFADSGARKITARALRKIFLIRTCKTLPKKECLYYHLGMCSAPCISKISEQDYAKGVEQAISVLQGKEDNVLERLHVDMKSASEKKEYEFAKRVRDQIAALKVVTAKQHVDTIKSRDEDVVVWVYDALHIQFLVMHIVKGVILGKEDMRFEHLDESAVQDFLCRYYEQHAIPHKIILGDEIEDFLSLEIYLSRLRGTKVSVLVPQKGESVRLLEIAKENAFFALNKRTLSPGVAELQNVLRMENPPEILECFDISTHMGDSTVASMVQFKEGKPHKSEYRHFHIRTVTQNDFAAMHEVVGRRYARLIKEGTPLPNLILIDGGMQQLRFAYEALQKLGVNIPLIALAKQEEEIYTLGLKVPLRLSRKDPALKLLQRIRDEAHRFAITFHRKTKTKKMLE